MFYCECCGENKQITLKNPYIGSHLKRIHNINIFEYVKKYYKCISNVNIEKCGFCDKNALLKYDIDHIRKTYKVSYNGFHCGTQECKDKIFNEFYPNKKFSSLLYSRIGSRHSYLARKYKISNEEAKNMKVGERDESLPYRTNLHDYKIRYGEKEGTKRYYERCKKISRANTKQYYLEQYGKVKGQERWKSYINKLKNKNLGNSTSKAANKISNILNDIGLNYKEEFLINEDRYTKRVDYYLPDKNIVIEFFGDYWHANPNCFDKDDIHKTLKISAGEIWAKDNKRNKEILSNIKGCSIIIIWESTKISSEYLDKLINNIQDKETIVYA